MDKESACCRRIIVQDTGNAERTQDRDALLVTVEGGSLDTRPRAELAVFRNDGVQDAGVLLYSWKRACSVSLDAPTWMRF